MTEGIGIGQLVEELQKRGERLPFEIGAFVALEACEASLRAPVKLDPDDVRVTGEGAVMIAPEASRAEPDESADSLVSMLARLMVAAGPGVPPNLLRLVEAESPGDLQRVHDEIEASLIPLNRSASRRVLARLVRESSRPPPPMRRVAGTEPSQVDVALDELLGVAPEPPSFPELSSATPEAADLVGSEFELPLAQPAVPLEVEPIEVEPRDDELELVDITVPIKRTPHKGPEDIDTVDETLDHDETLPGLNRGPGWWAMWAVALGVVALIAVLVERGVLSWPETSTAAPEPGVAPAASPLIDTGSVQLEVIPPEAQLFIFAGRGPVRITGLSQGSAHEFVAFDNGYRPSRAAVPKDAEWTTTPEGPLYELAMQSHPDQTQTGLDLGSPQTTPSVAADAPAGTVRVLTTPRGLKVYRYLGTGAQHTIPGLSPQLGHELLLFHPQRAPSRVVIGPSDWVSRNGEQSVQLKVTLPAP